MLGKRALNPGEKTEMKVTFNTAGAPGPFRKRITMTTNAPGQEEIQLSMTGNVREAPGAKIQVNPRKGDFGTVQAGSTARLQYTVTNTGTLPLFLKRVFSQESKHIYSDWTAVEMVIDPGQSAVITIEITPQKPGVYSERLVIVSNAKNAPKSGYIILGTGRVE